MKEKVIKKYLEYLDEMDDKLIDLRKEIERDKQTLKWVSIAMVILFIIGILLV